MPKLVNPKILTERLLLRRWRPSDHLPFATMCADPLVMRFVGSGATMTDEQVAKDIANYEMSWKRNGFGQFAIETRTTGQFVGFAGLGIHTLLHDYASFVEIGWRLDRKMWGQGYATEAASAALRFAINACRIKRIVSVCQSENVASEKIMQNLGLAFEREGRAPNNGRMIKIYALKNCYTSDT